MILFDSDSFPLSLSPLRLETTAFSDRYTVFEKLDTEVLGVFVDSVGVGIEVEERSEVLNDLPGNQSLKLNQSKNKNKFSPTLILV